MRPSPAQIVIAVPAVPESTCREFAGIVDDVVCATMPTPFFRCRRVVLWIFREVSDEEVRELLTTPTTGVACILSSRPEKHRSST